MNVVFMFAELMKVLLFVGVDVSIVIFRNLAESF